MEHTKMDSNSTSLHNHYVNNTSMTSNMSLNETSNSTFPARDESLARVEIVVQSVILALAVLGNSIVLTSLFLRRKSLTRMHVLMIHLSLADLFVAFCSVLPQLAWDVTFVFKGGDFLCRLVKYMQVVAIYASSYVLLTTAIDRYLAICHPFLSHKLPSTMVHKLVLIAWALSLLFSIPQVFIFSYELNAYGLYDCWATFDPPWTMTLYITTFTCLVYVIPIIILVFCYGNICIAVWKSGKTDFKQRMKKTKVSKHNTMCRIQDTTELSSSIFTTNDQTCMGEATRSPIVRFSYKFRANFKRHGHSTVIPNRDGHSDTITKEPFNAPVNRHKSEKLSKDVSEPSIGMTAIEVNTHNNHEGTVAHWRTETSHKGEGHRASHDSGISRAKLKTIKLTMTVVICYLACWSPFFIAQMWAVYDVNAPFNGSAYTIILLLASLNSCTNPWIYLIYSDIFFTCFKTVFSRIPQS